MQTYEIDNTVDIIDSRDIIERIEELQDIERDTDEQNELDTLLNLAEQAQHSPDWMHGEVLISRSYFVNYITDLIHDCYPMPKEMNSGQWPFRHITIDYEAAAREAEVDYMFVYFDDVEYLIRA
jgi:hypothetical protein